jgi:hypothetical protein
MNLNDLQLCEALLKTAQLARSLNRLRRDGETNELFQALGEIHRHAQLAMYRIMDIQK